MHNYDLIISGGGLAGAALAAGLASSQLRIALIEAEKPARVSSNPDSRVYAISPTNAKWLDKIGIWKHLPVEKLSTVAKIRVIGDQGHELVFSAHQAGLEELAWIIESSTLSHELWENLKRQANLTVFCPTRPTSVSFDQDKARLTLTNGTCLQAELIVAADGHGSWLRRAAKVEFFDMPYHEKGIVASFACELEHQQTAWQWFRHDGILAFLPLPGKNISVVWSAPDAYAEELIRMDSTVFTSAVSQATSFLLGNLQLITTPIAFPLRLVRVPQIVYHRLALVGDAAHGIHPLSGHGINLGFQDACVLAQLLSNKPSWQDAGNINWLRRYQRARREEIVMMQTMTDLLHKLFINQVPGAAKLRNLGLSALNRAQFVKSLLTRYAIGAFQ